MALHIHANTALGALGVDSTTAITEINATTRILKEVSRALLLAWKQECLDPDLPATRKIFTGHIVGIPLNERIKDPRCSATSADPVDVEIARRQFHAFALEWESFIEGLKLWDISSGISTLWMAPGSETFESIMQYKKTAVDWREKAKSVGAKIVSPRPPTERGVPWGKIATVAVTVGALYVAAKVIPPLLKR